MAEKLRIPGYRIERKLGQGGMASVHLAIQKSFERRVALKIMSPALNSDPAFATRFMREARIVANLSHASIVPVFEVGEHGPYHYLSMEYLPAGDLKTRIMNGERSLDLALDVCIALSAALDVAHRKGFIHRDIKPENILFREDGTPVLTDFGIARAVDSGQALTLQGMVVGTPNYMSPEQIKGLELDGRSDLYAVGVVFYEILTGNVPFRADSSLSVALKHVSEPLPALPAQFEGFQEFLDRLTAKDPDERFATGADVIRELRQIASRRSIIDQTLVRPSGAQENAAPPASAQDTAAELHGLSTGEADPPLPQVQVNERSRGRKKAKTADRVERASAWREPRRAAKTPRPASQPRPDPPPRRRRRRGWLGLGLIAAVVGAAYVMHSSRPSLRLLGLAPHGEQTSLLSAHVALHHRYRGRAERFEAERVKHRAPSSPQVALAFEPPLAPPEMALARHPSSANPLPVARSAGPLSVEDARIQEEEAHKRLAEERRARREREIRLVRRRAAQLAAQADEVRIRELLVEAKEDLAEGNLWQPAGACAADSYRAILQLRPSQPEALAGAHRLAAVLVEEAQRTEATGDIYTSILLIEQVRSLQSDNPMLPELQVRLKQMEASPTELDGRVRSRLASAAAHIAEARMHLEHIPLDGNAINDATEEYDRALAAEPMAPGLPSLKWRLIAAYPVAVLTELSRHKRKRAIELIATALRRHWSSPELDQIEATMHLPPWATGAQGH